jgi:hypothetical protein
MGLGNSGGYSLTTPPSRARPDCFRWIGTDPPESLRYEPGALVRLPAPGLNALPEGEESDRKGRDRIGPPPSHGGVEKKPDQQDQRGAR